MMLKFLHNFHLTYFKYDYEKQCFKELLFRVKKKVTSYICGVKVEAIMFANMSTLFLRVIYGQKTLIRKDRTDHPSPPVKACRESVHLQPYISAYHQFFFRILIFLLVLIFNFFLPVNNEIHKVFRLKQNFRISRFFLLLVNFLGFIVGVKSLLQFLVISN